MFLLEFNLALTHKHPFANTSYHFIKSNFINFIKEVTFSILYNAIIAKYLQTVLSYLYYLANSSTKIYIFFVKIKNQAWFILVRSKSICSKVTKILHWYNFLTKHFCVQRSIYFYNSMITKKIMDLIPTCCLNLFVTCIDFTSSTSKEWQINLVKNKGMIINWRFYLISCHLEIFSINTKIIVTPRSKWL